MLYVIQFNMQIQYTNCLYFPMFVFILKYMINILPMLNKRPNQTKENFSSNWESEKGK